MRKLGLADFARLLKLPSEATPRALYRGSMSPSAKLVELFLSVLQAEGAELGELGRAHLDMAVRRQQRYAELAELVCSAVPRARPIKGRGIAEHFPPELCRGSVDLDLYVPDTASVWRAATLIQAAEPVLEVNVSMLRRAEGDDLFVGLTWSSPESALDAIYRVEFSTLPLLGDGRSVPPRRGLPAHPVVSQILLVAEEQFQRPVIGRDLIDVAVMLDRLTDVPPSSLATEAAHWRLTPELAALVDGVDELDLAASGYVAALREALAALLQAELARRHSIEPSGLEYGFPLSTELTAEEATVEDHAFGGLLRCPFGTYLLTRHAEVDEAVYEQACVTVGIEPDGGW